MTNEKIPNVYDDEHQKKKFVDPVSVTTPGVFLFILAEMLKVVVGFLTLKWFTRVWNKWVDKNESDDQGIIEKKP